MNQNVEEVVDDLTVSEHGFACRTGLGVPVKEIDWIVGTAVLETSAALAEFVGMDSASLAIALVVAVATIVQKVHDRKSCGPGRHSSPTNRPRAGRAGSLAERLRPVAASILSVKSR